MSIWITGKELLNHTGKRPDWLIAQLKENRYIKVYDDTRVFRVYFDLYTDKVRVFPRPTSININDFLDKDEFIYESDLEKSNNFFLLVILHQL